MQLSVGQEVTVRPDLKSSMSFSGCGVMYEMVQLAGKKVTISAVEFDEDDGLHFYQVEHESVEYLWWTIDMFRLTAQNDEEAFDLLLRGVWGESEYEEYLKNK